MNSDATTPANPTTDDSGPIPADQSTPGGAVYQHDDPAYRVFVDSLNHLDPDEIATVLDAYNFSEQAHQGQTRLSGEPYITHPLAVAGALAEWRMDVQAVIAALLHDVMEDTAVTKTEIAVRFGKQVADLVDVALSDGRLLPSQEPWARDLGKTNIAALTAYLDTAPKVAALSGTQTGGKPPEATQTQPDDALLAVCSMFGNDPAAVQQTLNQE